MARAYSDDLRLRVVGALEEGHETQNEVAARFRVGIATVWRWWRLPREDGTPAPRQYRHGPLPRMSAQDAEILEALLQERADMRQAELGMMGVERGGLKVSVATIRRHLERLGWTQKRSPPSLRAGRDLGSGPPAEILAVGS